jgi:mutator protein MutT
MPKRLQINLVFLVKEEDGAVARICLAMKKRGFGVGRWNGVGGKAEAGETAEESARRETHEEIGVELGKIKKAASLDFSFSCKPEWDQTVTVYLASSWRGEPVESEEMHPQWFGVADIPYGEMWPDDRFWLPSVLSGKSVKAEFVFGPEDAILAQKVEEVGAFGLTEA